MSTSRLLRYSQRVALLVFVITGAMTICDPSLENGQRTGFSLMAFATIGLIRKNRKGKFDA